MAENFDQQLTRFFRKLDDAIIDYNRKDRKRITRKAASKVAVEGRRKGQPFPDYKNKKEGIKNPYVHYRGRKPKRIKYHSGNLRRSVQVLPKTGKYDSWVGPILRRGKGKPKAKEYGGIGQPADGYYAQMLYGSAKAYRASVLVRALRLARPAASAIMAKEMRLAIIKRGVRRGITRG